ncbi:RluA family pseudouridine synthase [Thalassotalea profundi]|uniref:RNA pseudouridine synthase n=1 Tax=Thalassotalea profundi TaxID=2036687 RepID=A0ABQ3IAR8_9GAMM|nr:pseudouridine synthase [Thalassotalea profundi]GHE77052.1 RNA pseudouridine synthase [Thalassotalea profundi]
MTEKLLNCFTRFKQPITDIELPKRFTFPFYYQPHALCEIAAKELQQHLSEQNQWQHNFGLLGNEDNASGKMFGVLVVKNNVGDIGYLAAFSGKLANKNLHKGFVPPVFDMLVKDNFFLTEQQAINDINDEINTLTESPKFNAIKQQLSDNIATSSFEISQLQQKHTAERKERKAQRVLAKASMTADGYIQLDESLNAKSIANKNSLKMLKATWQNEISKLEQKLFTYNNRLDTLKALRRTRSNALQKKIFEQYQFLNIKGDKKDINELFKNSPHPPPAGTGECAAPKLLQYAFANNFTPIALAEFWWGASPKSEIRQHGNYYPACNGKCQPILTHMLEGMLVDNNPMFENPAQEKHLTIIYQDNDIVVVNKPAELLSVPGKNINDSVLTRIQQLFPHASGGIIVHRLDMSTSGLMVLALHSRAHKSLQKQFINREIKKRYMAVIAGELSKTSGIITLPLRGDLHDRPRQLVCYEHGKSAETTWQLISKTAQHSRLYLSPKTGRTHQLRVHCAHINGLNSPIVGDDLYGKKAKRLHLHAESLEFNHPITRAKMHFQCDADF